jgi:hypothetical protein
LGGIASKLKEQRDEFALTALESDTRNPAALDDRTGS